MRTSAKQVLDFCAPHRERDQGNTWSQNLLNCESRKKEKVGAFRSARKSRTLPFSAFFMAEQRISRELFHRGRDGDVDGKPRSSHQMCIRDSDDIDAVTGATISSKAALAAVNEAIEAYRSAAGEAPAAAAT